MSRAVSVLMFMDDYTFDLKPRDHKAPRNQNSMWIYEPAAAWEAGLLYGIFLSKDTFARLLKR